MKNNHSRTNLERVICVVKMQRKEAFLCRKSIEIRLDLRFKITNMMYTGEAEGYPSTLLRENIMPILKRFKSKSKILHIKIS